MKFMKMKSVKIGICYSRDPTIPYMGIQWNLSIMDTLGTEKQFIVQRFPLFRGYLICTAIYLVPQKLSVIERFSLLGEFVIQRFLYIPTVL